MNRIWQFSTSAALRKRRTVSGWPLICSPRTASSRRAPKGSLPRMPMTKGSVGAAKACARPFDEVREVEQKNRLAPDIR